MNDSTSTEMKYLPISATGNNTVDSELRTGLNTIENKDGSRQVVITRNKNVGSNPKGGTHYVREYLTVFNLPEFPDALAERCFLEGLKTVCKAYHNTVSWNVISLVDYAKEHQDIEDFMASRSSSDYQERIKEVYERFTEMCQTLADSKGKSVSAYKPFIGLLKQTGNIKFISPDRLKVLRALWAKYLSDYEDIESSGHEMEGNSHPKWIVNLNRAIWFDFYEDVIEEVEDLV